MGTKGFQTELCLLVDPFKMGHPIELSRLSLSLPGRLVPGSPAETCGLLHVDDELLAVNGQDVSQMDHSDIVSLIKSSGMSIHLTVQQPDPGGVCVCVCVCVYS